MPSGQSRPLVLGRLRDPQRLVCALHFPIILHDFCCFYSMIGLPSPTPPAGGGKRRGPSGPCEECLCPHRHLGLSLRRPSEAMGDGFCSPQARLQSDPGPSRAEKSRLRPRQPCLSPRAGTVSGS